MTNGSDDTRPYDSPVRRRQVAETRQRIVGAGAAIAHELPTWDWRALTFKAVAERAGVSRRTVFRHFSTERELRDAIMGRLQEEAGVSLDGLRLDGVADLVRSTFEYLGSFSTRRPQPSEPTFDAVDEQRRRALLDAVAQVAPDWDDDRRRAVAAVLDVLWASSTHDRLLTAWRLDPAQTTSAATWAVGLVEDAVRRGDGPPA